MASSCAARTAEPRKPHLASARPVTRRRFAIIAPITHRVAGSTRPHARTAGHGSAFPTLLFRPSETIETYLYFFIFAYLLVLARRIKELEVAEGALPR